MEKGPELNASNKEGQVGPEKSQQYDIWLEEGYRRIGKELYANTMHMFMVDVRSSSITGDFVLYHHL